MGLVTECITKNYGNFKDRASRKEYWSCFLAFVIFGLIASILHALLIDRLGNTISILFALVVLFSLIPMIAVTVRRLHDTNRSGWYYLINFIPFGSIVLLIFLVQKGDSGPNRYGENPLNPEPLVIQPID